MQTLGLADCKFTSASLTAFVESVTWETAGIVEVALDSNPIGYPSISLKPGVESVAVKKGVFAAVAGRFGEVTMDPDGDNDVKLIWLDDRSESSYTKVNKLTSAVASRGDLIEEHLHIQALGEAISGSKVKTLGLAHCGFTSATLATFVESVTWETAGVTKIDISGADIDTSTLDALKTAAPEGCEVVWKAPAKDG